MGINYNRKNRNWEVSYSKRHPLTKRPYSLRRIGIKTKSEAEKVYRELIVQLNEKLATVHHPMWKDTVLEFLEDYRNRGVKEATVLNYQHSLGAHTFKRWEKTPIYMIKTHDIRTLILNDLESKSEWTRKSFHKYLNAVFNFALEKGIINRNPMPKLNFKLNQKIKKVLTESEIKLFLKTAREDQNQWFPIWATACFTGMRNGELYALKWEDVSLSKRTMVIRRSWNRYDGFKDTKSGDDRVIEIAHALAELFEKLPKCNEFVLPRLEDWEKGLQSKRLRDYLKPLGLSEIRFHDLRASWATVMLSKGVEPIKVMAMGGWKDLKTMQIYVRKSGIHIQGITDSLDFL